MIMMRVGMIVVPGFDVMSFAPLSVFDAANITLGEQRYEVRVLSETGGRTRNSFGMEIVTEPLGCDEFDTIIVGTSHDIGPAPPGIIAFLQNASGSARRIASICIGAFTLAQAGLLDGRRATTHWLYSRELQSRFPKIKVEVDRIFIADGPVWTSAGMTAGIDLALGLVERDVGPEAARVVARALVVHHRRAGGGNRNILPCWSSMRNPIVCRTRWSLPDAISMSRCRWNGSPKRPASARASSVACFASKPGNRLQERSRTSGWRPPDWRWNKGGAPSKQSRRKLALATGSACAERSYALLGKRRRRFATRHTHSLRSDRAFRSIVPPSRAARPTERPKRALPYRQSMEWDPLAGV